MEDVVIIGGSNAGLSAALVLGRARRRVLVLDNGQPRNAPSPAVHSFLTRDGTPPAELHHIALQQLQPYPTVTVQVGEAIAARREDDGFSVTTSVGETLRACGLLLATGVKDELPPIDGLAERWGEKVVHCPYCHGWEVRERPLAVLASGGRGVEYTLTICGWSDDVTLLTNGLAQLAPDERERLRRHGVATDERTISRIEDGPEDMVRLVFADGGGADYAALFHGPRQQQASDLARQLGCELYEPFPGIELIRVDAMGQTTVPGVYAAGDAATMMQQAIVAAGAGLVAAASINRELLALDFA